MMNLLRRWRESFSGLTRQVWLLAFANFINRCGAMVLGFLTIYLTKELKFSVESAGFAMACFGIGAVFGNFIGGILTDKWGSFDIMKISLTFNGIILFVMMFVTEYWTMCGTLFFFSLVSELFRPANSTAVARAATPETYTRSYSLLRLAFNLGWTVAPALGGFLAFHVGWKWLFIGDGITCLFAAAFITFNKELRIIRHEAIQTKTLETQEKKSAPPPINPYTDWHYLSFIFLTFINAYVFLQLLWTVPLYFEKGLGFNESEIGLLVGFNGLLVVLLEMPLIFRIENSYSKIRLIQAGLLLYAVSYFTLNLSVPAIVCSLICIIGLSFGEILVMPFSTNLVVSFADKNSQGKYMALYSIAYSTANIIAPLIGTQIIAKKGYFYLWNMVGYLAIIDLIGFYFLRTSAKQQTQLANS